MFYREKIKYFLLQWLTLRQLIVSVIIVSVDCIATVWSVWSPHDSQGLSRRERFVTQQPLNGGKECGHLIETRLGTYQIVRLFPIHRYHGKEYSLLIQTMSGI